MKEINVLVKQENGSISFNFDEIKQQLANEMKLYKTMVFTEDSKKEATSTVANLRKLKKAISDRRIEVKKSFMQPYADFEASVNELIILIEEPISFINQQIEEFERKRVAERKCEIDAIYTECIANVKEYLPLSRIYNSKWENATTSLKAISEEITAKVIAVQNDIKVITDMKTDAIDKALDVYKETLSLADTIQFVTNWEKQKAEIVQKMEEKERPALSEPESVEEAVSKCVEPTEEKATMIRYEVKADAFQIVQLESAMRELDIEYRRV